VEGTCAVRGEDRVDAAVIGFSSKEACSDAEEEGRGAGGRMTCRFTIELGRGSLTLSGCDCNAPANDDDATEFVSTVGSIAAGGGCGAVEERIGIDWVATARAAGGIRCATGSEVPKVGGFEVPEAWPGCAGFVDSAIDFETCAWSF
jgi:hypothetical protein